MFSIISIIFGLIYNAAYNNLLVVNLFSNRLMLFAKDFLMNQRPILGEVILWHLGQCEVSTQDIVIMYMYNLDA